MSIKSEKRNAKWNKRMKFLRYASTLAMVGNVLILLAAFVSCNTDLAVKAFVALFVTIPAAVTFNMIGEDGGSILPWWFGI